MLLWIAIGGALATALARWRIQEARGEREVRAADEARRARRSGRGRARVTRLEPTSARLLGMPAYRIELALPIGTRTAELKLTRALPAVQLVWMKVGAEVDLTYDPDDLANYVTELEGRFADEIAARVERSQQARTRVELPAPLWLVDHDGADAWLLPHAGGAPHVIIGAFGGDTEPPALAAAAHLAAAELALTTAARVCVTVIAQSAERMAAGDPDPAHEHGADGALVIWSHAPRDRAVGDVTLRVRGMPGEPLPPLTAPLGAIPAALATTLVEAKLLAATEPPGWYAPPREPAATAYEQIVTGLVRQLLADPARAALPPLPAAQHAAIVDRAFQLAHKHDDAHVHLGALACCFHAARAGAMTLEHRVYAGELVGHYAGTGHPIDLLSPSLLSAMNLRKDARRRALALRGDTAAFRAADSTYHAWLARWLA